MFTLDEVRLMIVLMTFMERSVNPDHLNDAFKVYTMTGKRQEDELKRLLPSLLLKYKDYL